MGSVGWGAVCHVRELEGGERVESWVSVCDSDGGVDMSK
jgi:hypothetical protein